MNVPDRMTRSDKTRRKSLWRGAVLLGLFALSVLIYGKAFLSESARPSRESALRFTDARRQAAEFISYDHSIVLTPDQQKVMDAALSSIPAPCCDQYSIATCCCPCNLARSVWGLSKFLIAKQHAGVAQVNAASNEWLQFTNPAGYTGDACFTRGCNRPFQVNGCGGMDDGHIR